MARLTAELDHRTYDVSGMGPGLEVSAGERHPLDLDRHQPCNSQGAVSGSGVAGPGEVRRVNQLGLGFFSVKVG